MSVTDRFRAFFAAANSGAGPYPWQVALVERIAETGEWPTAITAPTGAGKSSVVDVHVFLVAERERQRATGAPTVARPPRRLVLVAPRRVLVDDQHAHALRLAELLRGAVDDSPLGEARAALARLVTSLELREDPSGPLGVARLRGGVRLDLSWRLDPARCQIVCATPQMWGSRLLMRGFRSSQRARNLESGLLAHDVSVVIDEAHLHRRLVDTSQRVAAMAGDPGRLQVVAMSATHDAQDGHTLGPDDLAHPALAQRVNASKSVDIELVDDWVRERAPRIVDAARWLRDADADVGTVGVFVNTVALALEVADRLKSGDDPTVRVVCGRMRPADLDRLRHEFPGLLDAGGNRDVDFLVATQSLEVGVDLDLGAIVSELAPGSALAQRAGRLNRSGSRPRSTLVVVAPAELAGESALEECKPRTDPYEPEQLQNALRWLAVLDGDASPQRISATAPPSDEMPSVPGLTAVELETLAMTSIALAADPDPAFYVEDPVDSEERRVLIGARDHLALDPAVVGAALLAAPPRAHELATMSDGKVLDAIRSAGSPTWVLRTMDGKTTALQIKPEERVQAGDVLLVPSGSRVVVERVLGAPRYGSAPIDDVVAARPPSDGVADVVLRLDDARAKQVSALAERDPVLGTRIVRRELADIVETLDSDLAKRLRRHRRLSDLTVSWCGDEERPDAPGLLVVVSSDREGRATEGIASEERLVRLDDHCAAVARRAREIVEALDELADDEAANIEDAARLHDEGKRHPAFQQRMGAPTDGPALAKPVPGHKPDRGDGWRHEQFSAGVAHALLRRPLVTALTAAHHGNGRPMFNRDADAVLAGWNDAPADVAAALAELFGSHGCYEMDRAALQRELGVHRLAFLEALIRCADMQISREVQD